MLIFNQGKYKSLHAAQIGELEAIESAVKKDPDFRPHYHLAPPTGLLNDPNGLIFDGEKYHIFYQWYPFDAIHGMKHWRHYTTQDFIHFQSADPLIPDELFESHGCYSGGALYQNEQLLCFYTGNTRRSADNQRVPFQNLAVFDRNGKLLEKRPLLNQAAKGYTEHFRDPKPFFTQEGKIRFICGAQRENLSGTAVLFEMDDRNSDPRMLGELSLNGFDNHKVFMWECPDLLKIDQRDIFIWSPQGKPRENHQFQNNYHATYAVGKLTDLDFQAEHIAELDQGFDFYAPQTFANVSNRALMLAWIGLPDLTYPTDQYHWHSMLSLPRELTLQDNRLFQQPATEIYQNLTALQQIELNNELEIADLDRAYLRFNPQNQPFEIQFFDNLEGEKLILSYQQNLLCLDRTFSQHTESMKDFGAHRYCEVENVDCIEIFFDRSVCEIFINQGEKTMTSRFFIANRQNHIKTDRTLSMEIAYPQAIAYQD